jgi:four helix bundle protein
MAIQKFEDIMVWQKAKYFSLASNSEVRSILYLAIRLNFISEVSAKKLIDNSNEIARMIFGFIKSLK